MSQTANMPLGLDIAGLIASMPFPTSRTTKIFPSHQESGRIVLAYPTEEFSQFSSFGDCARGVGDRPSSSYQPNFGIMLADRANSCILRYRFNNRISMD